MKGKRGSLGNSKIGNEDFSQKELAKALSEFDLKDFVNVFIAHLRKNHNFTYEQVAEAFGKKIPTSSLLPISIFNNSELSCLETIVKYLKEELSLRYHEIALGLNRDDRTIWTTYNNASRKRSERLIVNDSEYFIPASVFKNRRFSVLEAIVSYLKNKFGLRYSEISVLLNRDERNIWTAYNRAKKKNG